MERNRSRANVTKNNMYEGRCYTSSDLPIIRAVKIK